ncbi:MAG: ABC transporter substrate-binding protein, partial [Spirochaetales bacterium]
MKKALFSALIIVFAVSLSVLAGCSRESASKTGSNEITIAFIGNTTGDYAMYGLPVRNSVAMFFEKLNAAGGINGKKINLLEYDDKGDPTEAVNAYNLAKSNGATAIIGSV